MAEIAAVHLPDAGADLQAIIAAKISLREEIKAELRAEFSSLVTGVSGVSEARHLALSKTIDELRTEVIRQADERSMRYLQRFEAVEQNIKDSCEKNDLRKDILEARLDATDLARELLATETEKRQRLTDALLADLKNVQTAADQVVDARAQAANDALERLLNSSINATTSISDVRHEATQLAITKVESQLTSAFVASKAAIDAALTTANSAVDAVDKKSFMRCEAAEAAIRATEDKLMGRVTALKELLDLGNDMGKEAITKAENASEKRFEGLNELRGAMSDQAASFLPRSEAEARFNSTYDKMEQLVSAVASSQLDMKSMMRRDDLKPVMDDITKLRDVAAVSGGKEKVWAIVGSGGLAVCAIIVALFAAFHSPSVDRNPQVSENSNRVGDLGAQMTAVNAAQDARMTALTNQINALAAAIAKAEK